MMTNWKPVLSPPPWSNEDLESILDDALEVLERVGIQTRHPDLRRRLAAWGAVMLPGDRVGLDAGRMRSLWEAMRSAIDGSDEADDAFTMGVCWAGLTYCDPETLEPRPARQTDVIQMARLWDARGLSGVVPVLPGDVPPALVTLSAERIALESSRFLGGQLTVTDPEEVRFLIDMNLAAGRKYTLMEEVSISPLRINDLGLDTAMQFFGNSDVDVHITGAIPMVGVTCPLDPRGAVVQAVAERLALTLICHVYGAGGGGLDVRLEPFDFQYSTIVFGSPEWCLYRALVIQMSSFLSGRPMRGAKFRSVAKTPDEHAACERTASALWQALLGGRRFTGVGQLSVDEVFSPQQAVLDGEILAYVERVCRGLDLNADLDAVSLIKEGVAAGNFVGADDTVARYREFFDFPEVFRHWNLNRWRAEGSPSILGEAWARAQAEIATASFALPADRHAEVERIYARASEHVLGRERG